MAFGAAGYESRRAHRARLDDGEILKRSQSLQAGYCILSVGAIVLPRSVSQRKKTLLPLCLLVNPGGAASLVRLTAAEQFEPVEVAQLWAPLRTRLGGWELLEYLEVP